MGKISVIVTGASGKMGREVVKAVLAEDNLKLVGVVDNRHQGMDIGPLAGMENLGILIESNLEKVIEKTKPQVMVDFTNPDSVLKNTKIAISKGVYPVIGTTGLTPEEINELDSLAKEGQVACLIAPNFAIGAILMMKFAQMAAKHLPHVEIIELHHDQKLDAPSGTAIKTAEAINEVREVFRQGDVNEFEKIKGSRGGDFNGMRIHSVRLPGLVAHQEVIFGGVGQTLTIRHDSLNRESFMPGVVLGINKIINYQGVVYGLENLMND